MLLLLCAHVDVDTRDWALLWNPIGLRSLDALGLTSEGLDRVQEG